MADLEETRPTGHGRARGLVSSRASGQRVEARFYAPDPDLAPWVASLWKGAWDLRDQEPHVTELLGDPCVHFVFQRGSSRIVGGWTKLWRNTLRDRDHVRSAKLRAGAVSAFVDGPASDLQNRIVPLRDRLGPQLDDLEARILDPEDDAEGFEPLQDWLRSRLSREPDPRRDLAIRLAERASEDRDVMTVEMLAEGANLGVRAVQRLFRDHVGASPKWVIRRARLQQVALEIERGETPNLAQLAAALGYADQAHMARDFKDAVGKSPSAFRRSVASPADD